MRRIAAALAVTLTLCVGDDADLQAQMRAGRMGAGSLGDGMPQIVVPPVVTAQPPVSLEPLGQQNALVVAPPPAIHNETTPDGGGSDCRCPNGQKPDIDGWCWRPTDALTGYWAKTQKCQP